MSKEEAKAENKEATEKADAATVPTAGHEPEVITVSREKYQALETQATELKDRLLRGQADWENSRKRILKEKEEAVRYASEALLERLLPVLDNFEMGMEAARKASDPKAIAQGLEMVLAQFHQVMKDAGVEPIEAVGKPFDPHRHEAIGQQESEEHPEGHITSQVRKGYKLKDRLLRAASVFVAKPSEGKQANKK